MVNFNPDANGVQVSQRPVIEAPASADDVIVSTPVRSPGDILVQPFRSVYNQGSNDYGVIISTDMFTESWN